MLESIYGTMHNHKMQDCKLYLLSSTHSHYCHTFANEAKQIPEQMDNQDNKNII